jgi:hypothetical protein
VFETGPGTSAAIRGHDSLTERKPFLCLSIDMTRRRIPLRKDGGVCVSIVAHEMVFSHGRSMRAGKLLWWTLRRQHENGDLTARVF